MDARIGADSHLCGGGASIPKHHGKKKILEWDLNDWHWDGDQFTAKQTNASTSDCRNKQLFQFPVDREQYNSTDAHIDTLGRGNGESEKRRRVIVLEDGGLPDGDAFLNLKLGHVYPIANADITNLEGKNAEMGKLQLGSSNRGACQVEGCAADLSSSKEYHRRHKVCEVHAKSSSALVNNVFQRFCQQCSRFHLLQEFDEGKRSCRRRLAGHNRRRRKTHPDATANGMPTIDEQASSYLLISLIRILSNLQSDNSKDQDLLSNLIRSLGGLAGSVATRNLPGPLQTPQDNEEVGTCAENSSKSANGNGLNTQQFHESLPSTNTACVPVSPGAHQRPTGTSATIAAALKGTSFGNERKVSPANRTGLRDFDLNDAYNCTPNCRGSKRLAPAECLEDGPPICHPGMLPNSCQSTYALFADSTSTQLRSSSNGDAQNKTGRIVFKLFGKEPNDFPILLREQILDWLSHSPTDIESYIRPGCVILTIYVRQAESAWDELCHDLSSSLNRLLCNSGDSFWRSGWFYARVKHHIAFIYSGHVVLDTPRILKSAEYCNITCVTPIAVVISSKVEFRVKAVNLTNSTRLSCAFEGKYLVQEPVQSLVRATTACKGSQCLSLICWVPNATGRGFIEIEDHGLSGGFFPFIVAEEELCSEIRMLENAIDVTSYDVKFEQRTGNMTDRNQALEFLNEMGWLLRRSTQKGRSRELTGIPNGLFSLSRFRWLVAFAMDYQWCAVIKKLLDLLFDRIIDLGGIPPDEAVLSEELLHKAVRKNSRSMVEFLLAYKPRRATNLTCESNLFRADMNGPSKITPLHVAATMTEAESILDALTNDPAMLGIKAWSNSHDDTGFTPEDYAQARGHLSYVYLVNKKANKQLHKSPIVLDIPGSLLAATEATNKHSVVENSGKAVTTFAMDKSRLGSLKPILPPYCRLCSRRAHSSTISRSPVYRPLMLSMVGIAVVCVCVGLLLKGPPEVLFVYPPFTWESLDYGFI